MIDQRRAASFNQYAAVYDHIRPGYPPEMYADIQRVCHITPHSRILEIGVGSGIATHEMNTSWSPQIVGIEPGPDLYQCAREKLHQCSNIQLINQGFEEFESATSFDLIVSATAFHWIDPDIKYQKAAALLHPNGYLVVFRNYFSRDDAAVFHELQGLYEQHFPEQSLNRQDLRAVQDEKIREKTKELQDCGYFSVIFQQRYRWYKRFDAAGYVALLHTFSTHTVLPEERMRPFYEAVQEVIVEHGNEIHLPIDVSLDIAHQPRIPAG